MPGNRATVSELARLLAEGKKQAAGPSVNFKMVKPGELQFDFTVTPELDRGELFRMAEDGLALVARILEAAVSPQDTPTPPDDPGAGQASGGRSRARVKAVAA